MNRQTSEIKHKTGPVMTGEGLSQQTPEKTDVPWQSVDTAPKDGNPLWLKGADGKIIEAYWRRTRQYRKGRWDDIYFWAVYGQNPQVVPFAPALWTRGKSNAD